MGVREGTWAARTGAHLAPPNLLCRVWRLAGNYRVTDPFHLRPVVCHLSQSVCVCVCGVLVCVCVCVCLSWSVEEAKGVPWRRRSVDGKRSRAHPYRIAATETGISLFRPGVPDFHDASHIKRARPTSTNRISTRNQCFFFFSSSPFRGLRRSNRIVFIFRS